MIKGVVVGTRRDTQGMFILRLGEVVSLSHLPTRLCSSQEGGVEMTGGFRLEPAVLGLVPP